MYKTSGVYIEKKIVDFNFKVFFFFSFFWKKNYSGGSATPLGHMGWPNHPLGQNVGGSATPKGQSEKK